MRMISTVTAGGMMPRIVWAPDAPVPEITIGSRIGRLSGAPRAGYLTGRTYQTPRSMSTHLHSCIPPAIQTVGAGVVSCPGPNAVQPLRG